jgi:hypothetical protein
MEGSTMSQGELIYLIGVIAAFTVFAITLVAVTHGQHLPPAGTEDAKKPRQPVPGH